MKVRPFSLIVKPSSAHKDHLLVEVDSLTGDISFGPPLSADELIAITSQGNKMSLDNVSLTKVVTLLLNEVIKLRRQRDETT